MNNTHTNEPWCVTGDGDYTSIRSSATDELIAQIEWDGEEEGTANSNARRIVACVNACAGFDTETLEADPGLFAALFQEVERARGDA